MNRTTYACILRACAPARALARGRSDALHSAALWEQFGFGYALPPSGVAPVWVHALSLGENRAAQPLVQALLKRRWPVVLTHTTGTGRREGTRLSIKILDRSDCTPNRRTLAEGESRCIRTRRANAQGPAGHPVFPSRHPWGRLP